MHYLLWDVQHFGIHVQLANHKAILYIQFIVFLSQVGENVCFIVFPSQVGENICVRCVWHFGVHVQ